MAQTGTAQRSAAQPQQPPADSRVTSTINCGFEAVYTIELIPVTKIIPADPDTATIRTMANPSKLDIEVPIKGKYKGFTYPGNVDCDLQWIVVREEWDENNNKAVEKSYYSDLISAKIVLDTEDSFHIEVGDAVPKVNVIDNALINKGYLCYSISPKVRHSITGEYKTKKLIFNNQLSITPSFDLTNVQYGSKVTFKLSRAAVFQNADIECKFVESNCDPNGYRTGSHIWNGQNIADWTCALGFKDGSASLMADPGFNDNDEYHFGYKVLVTNGLTGAQYKEVSVLEKRNFFPKILKPELTGFTVVQKNGKVRAVGAIANLDKSLKLSISAVLGYTDEPISDTTAAKWISKKITSTIVNGIFDIDMTSVYKAYKKNNTGKPFAMFKFSQVLTNDKIYVGQVLKLNRRKFACFTGTEFAYKDDSVWVCSEEVSDKAVATSKFYHTYLSAGIPVYSKTGVKMNKKINWNRILVVLEQGNNVVEIDKKQIELVRVGYADRNEIGWINKAEIKPLRFTNLDKHVPNGGWEYTYKDRNGEMRSERWDISEAEFLDVDSLTKRQIVEVCNKHNPKIVERQFDQMIYETSQMLGINPIVLLATLGGENSWCKGDENGNLFKKAFGVGPGGDPVAFSSDGGVTIAAETYLVFLSSASVEKAGNGGKLNPILINNDEKKKERNISSAHSKQYLENRATGGGTWDKYMDKGIEFVPINASQASKLHYTPWTDNPIQNAYPLMTWHSIYQNIKMGNYSAESEVIKQIEPIKQSVGEKGKNKPADVQNLKRRLNELKYPVSDDGVILTPQDKIAIKYFQINIGDYWDFRKKPIASPSGLVDIKSKEYSWLFSKFFKPLDYSEQKSKRKQRSEIVSPEVLISVSSAIGKDKLMWDQVLAKWDDIAAYLDCGEKMIKGYCSEKEIRGELINQYRTTYKNELIKKHGLREWDVYCKQLSPDEYHLDTILKTRLESVTGKKIVLPEKNIHCKGLAIDIQTINYTATIQNLLKYQVKQGQAVTITQISFEEENQSLHIELK